jgi:ABC-type multidrug transport system fused ATPase/permease subunit
MALAQLVQARVSASRLEVFLELNEVGTSASIGEGVYIREKSETEGSIVINDAEIYWSDPKAPIDKTVVASGDDSSVATSANEKSTTELSDTELGPDDSVIGPRAVLRNINLEVGNGELCAVVGRVASGKSTLVSAILNETFLESGCITLKGSVAYAAQSPWILNATVRENILFGLPYDEGKYQRVIKACQLEHDLNILSDGDYTEIGERGECQILFRV